MANTGVVAEGGGSSSIYKAIVIDVMIDGQIPGDAANQNKLDGAPENSCLVRFYGNPVPAGDIVAYPFFPQHLQVPIKPGEAVWVISPSITEPDINECYWVGKIATSQLSNNVNYSHPFRKPQPPEPSSAGMARFMFWRLTMPPVAMPINRPLSPKIGPPLLPGFSAALT